MSKGLRVQHLMTACVDEFKENEDLPNTTNPDDWARISGKKGERIVYIRTLVTEHQGLRDRPVHRHRRQHRPVPLGRPDAPVSSPHAYARAHDRRRVMGIETEYGVSVPGQPAANAMTASSQVVNGYVGASPARDRRTRWDFEEENPLRDARGFDARGRRRRPQRRRAEDDLGLANVILTNGARLYVDHAHPEYSSPEVTNPRDAVLWDKAGERVMALAAERAAHGARHRADPAVQEQHRRQGRVVRHARELPGARGRRRSASWCGT